MKLEPGTRCFKSAVAGALVLAGVAAYWNTLPNEFVWDDASSVLLHEHVQDPSKFAQLFREDQHAFGRGQGNFYRPLVSASFMLDFWLAFEPPPDWEPGAGIPDVEPLLFHITNAAWHIIAALGLFALLVQLRAPRAVQLLVPLLYAVHPLHTEAVTYISGRADPMAGAFLFWGLAAALWRGNLWKRIAGPVLALACCVGGLLSKESAAVFPVLLALAVAAIVWQAPREHRVRETVLGAIPVALTGIAVAVYVYLRMTVLAFGEGGGFEASPLGQRIVETVQAFALYLKLIFVPTGLHMERTLDNTPMWVGSLGGLTLAGMTAALTAAIWFKHARIAAGIAWFLVAWLPISGLFPLNAPMAEHWMYVPLAGFIWALIEASYALYRYCLHAYPIAWKIAWKPALGVILAAGLALMGLTIDRNRDWRDDVALFRNTLAHNPNSLRVHYNLAVTYESETRNYAGAIRHYQRVLDMYEAMKRQQRQRDLVWPQELEAHLSIGNLHYDHGRFSEAITQYRSVAEKGGAQQFMGLAVEAVFNMGKCHVRQGEISRGVQLINQALRMLPDLGPEAQEVLQGRVPGNYS